MERLGGERVNSCLEGEGEWGIVERAEGRQLVKEGRETKNNDHSGGEVGEGCS